MALQSALADPTPPWTIAVNEIAAAEEVPVTILIGQQTGRLASDEDQTHFAQMIMSRRENFATSMVMDVVKRMIKINALPAAEINDLHLVWDDLTDTTQAEKLDTAKKMAEINANPLMDQVFSREEIRENAGFKPDEGADSDLDDPPEGGDFE